MSKITNLLAGFGGAIALNILHESLKRKNNNMPRIDLLGEEALQKTAHLLGGDISDDDELYLATLGADIVSNGMYFSLIGAADKKSVWPKAIGMGLAAGIGALVLPKPMGLDPKPIARNYKVGALTVGYYLAGAVVTACILNSVSKRVR